MSSRRLRRVPDPIIDERERQQLALLTARYEKLVEPGPVRQLATKVAKSLPEPVKKAGESIKDAITEQELYEAALEVIGEGFDAVQKQAARFSVSEERIVEQVGQTVEGSIESLDEVCLARSYDVSSIVSKRRASNIAAAFAEGAATGAPGFVGIPFNLVLSTFLYFRAAQVIAMSYGYDARNDATEMEIAGQVFANAMDPIAGERGGGMAALIGKIMMVCEADALKRAAAKGWAEMIARGGAGLLLAQMRGLANKAAQKALAKAGAKGLENSVFRSVFEQIGRRLALTTVQRAVPFVSAVIGAFFDSGQMNKVLEYADVFYAKRFILEKESRIAALCSGEANFEEAYIVDIEDEPSDKSE